MIFMLQRNYDQDELKTSYPDCISKMNRFKRERKQLRGKLVYLPIKTGKGQFYSIFH